VIDMAKKIEVAELAKSPEEIAAHYFEQTDKRQAKVNVAPEARGVLKDFLTGLDENLTVRDVIAALEEQWS